MHSPSPPHTPCSGADIAAFSQYKHERDKAQKELEKEKKAHTAHDDRIMAACQQYRDELETVVKLKKIDEAQLATTLEQTIPQLDAFDYRKLQFAHELLLRARRPAGRRAPVHQQRLDLDHV